MFNYSLASSPQKNNLLKKDSKVFDQSQISNSHKIMFDQYFLIYGIKISSELYHDIIDFVVDSGEWEGELMEFIGDDEWYFFEIEGRGKPDRYDYLEGFLEDNFGFQSIFNAKGENTLYVGKIVWSTNVLNIDDNNRSGKMFIDATEITKDVEFAVNNEAKIIKQRLKEKNEYWSDKLPNVNYYWIRGTDNY